MSTQCGALSGTRVLDLTGHYPGALCTMMLADAGAEVVKVERPPAGDPSRMELPVFAVTGRSRRSIIIDLKDPAGKDVLWRLIDTADVLIEGFRPGKLASLGFGDEEVRCRHPQLVYCSLSGFGQSGPWRDVPGHDLSYLALAGALHTWVREAGMVTPTISLADVVAAMLAAYAITLGILSAQRTKEGQNVDISLFDAGLFTAMLDYGQRIVLGTDPERGVNSAIPHYRLFRCAEETALALAIVNEDPFWQSLTRALGLPEWERFSHPERLAHAEEIIDRLKTIFERSPASHWQKLLLSHDVPCGEVLSPGKAWTGTHARARGFVRPTDSAEGITPHLLTPIASEVMLGQAGTGLPEPGEHTVELLGELGFASEVINRLLGSSAVIGYVPTTSAEGE
ncbi:MAG: CoA transferase [Thermoleophilia bacterium]|nr:CoA transferase [Thermoleophilia bacterium]